MSRPRLCRPVDSLAVDQVCDGHRMPLRGKDLRAAAVRMNTAGVELWLIAHRLCTTERSVSRALQAAARGSEEAA